MWIPGRPSAGRPAQGRPNSARTRGRTFLVDGRLEAPPDTIRSPAQSGAILLASKLDWLIWLGLAALLVGGAWFVALA